MTRDSGDRQALHTRAKEILETGFYERSGHLQKRQRQRSITDAEIFEVIETGAAIDGPRFDPEFGSHEITLEGRVSTHGDLIVVVVAVDIEDEKVTVITAYSRDWAGHPT